MEIKASHKLVRKVKDNLFDEEQLDQYHLTVIAGSSDLQLIVADDSSGKFLLLEDYVFPDASGSSNGLHPIRHLFDSHHLLQAGFWKQISIGIKNQKFTQLPERLFHPENTKAVLGLNVSLDDQDNHLFWNGSAATDIITVFSVPDSIFSWLSGFYPKKRIRFIHQSAALIAGVESIHKGGDRLYAYIDRFRLHLIAMGRNGLRFYNQFNIRQFSDYTRYLMTVIGQMGLRQDACPVTLYGFVSKDSPHVQELRRYIKTLELGSRPANLSFSGAFNEIQEHQFFDIFAITHLRPTAS